MRQVNPVHRILYWLIDRAVGVIYWSMGGKTALPLNSEHRPTSERDQIIPKTRELIVRLMSINEDKLHPHLRLVEDLGANRLLLIDLTMQLEDEFNVELPDELAEQEGVSMQSFVAALEVELDLATKSRSH